MVAYNLPILYVARFLHGAPVCLSMTAGLVATCNRYKDDERERQRALTIGMQGFITGNLASYLIGSSFYQFLGLEYAFLTLAVFHAIELILCLIAVDLKTEQESTKGWWSILKDPWMIVAQIGIFHGFHYFTAWRTAKPEWTYRLGCNTFEIGLMLATATGLQFIVSFLFECANLDIWYKVFVSQFFCILGFVSLPFSECLVWVSVIPDVFILFAYAVAMSALGAFCANHVQQQFLSKSFLIVNTIWLFQTLVGSVTGGVYAGALVQAFNFLTFCMATAAVAVVVTVTIAIWYFSQRRNLNKTYEEF